jgi:hypothetical protein
MEVRLTEEEHSKLKSKADMFDKMKNEDFISIGYGKEGRFFARKAPFNEAVKVMLEIIVEQAQLSKDMRYIFWVLRDKSRSAKKRLKAISDKASFPYIKVAE